VIAADTKMVAYLISTLAYGREMSP